MPRILTSLFTFISTLSKRTRLIVGALVLAIAVSGISLALHATGKTDISHTDAHKSPQRASTLKTGDKEEPVQAASANKPATPPAGNNTSQTTAPATASPKPATPTAKTPAANPAPTPTPGHCPECGGDPDKVITHRGALLLSANTFTIKSGGWLDNAFTAQSDSGEAIAGPYVLYNINSPMITVYPSSASTGTYAVSQPASIVMSLNVAPGTYTLQLRATSQSHGEYMADITVIVTTP